MLITEIQTGKMFNSDARKAILIADEKTTKPGQLAELTEFLQSKGLTATPGYNEGHLLRVSNFESDGQLRDMLENQFPSWVKDRPNAMGEEQLFTKNMPFIPLDPNEKRPFAFKRFITQYSTPLVGALSFLSGAALLGNDITHFRKQKDAICQAKSGITAVAAGFFMSASALLAGFGVIAARKPSVTDLLKSLEPQLNQDPARFDPHVKRNAFQNAKDYALNNPWKIATVFNLFGVIIKSVGHALPSTQRVFTWKDLKGTERKIIDRMDLAGASSSLLSLGLIGTATTGDSPDILGIKTFQKSEQASDPLARRYNILSSRIFNPLDPANDEGKSGHYNMKAAGFLSMASNAFFSIGGANKVAMGVKSTYPEAKGLRDSWPLMLLLPFNIAADYLTTLSKPRFTYSIDELATEAADYIAHKLDMKTATAETVTAQMYILSELMGNDPQVGKSPHQLREAISARLALDHGYKAPDEGTGIKEYKHMREISPFTKIIPTLGAPAPAGATPTLQPVLQPKPIIQGAATQGIAPLVEKMQRPEQVKLLAV